jgi:1-acyl-sn-glycerol-3-phosphate acyltransferase
MLHAYVSTLTVFGRENLPSGPVLFLSNHPGMVDTLALFSALNHSDLRVIAVHRPFLAALPETSQYLDYLEDDPRSRIGLVRKVSTHLKQGGAVLTFPSGRIEPDPDVYPGAAAALQDWTDSVEVFVRLAPQTAVVPVLVRGVIWSSTASHPFIRLKRDQFEREKLAAALQLLAHVVLKKKPLDVCVTIGKPIQRENFSQEKKGILHRSVLERMTDLISQPETGKGEQLI